MKAVHLKLPSNAKFHLGEYTDDQNTALFNTANIIHSDVLFGAFISALAQIDSDKIEIFKTYFEESKLAFSSAFYVLNLEGENPVYLLPKPVSLNLYQPKDIEKFKVKKFKKIEFISKGVWEKGIKPEHWLSEDENSICVMPNKNTICLREEIGNEKFKLYQETDEEKVNLRPVEKKEDNKEKEKERKNELYTRTCIEILGNENVKVDFYFLIENQGLMEEEDEALFQSVLNLMMLNGFGGERTTGCGSIQGFEEKEFEIKVDDLSTKEVLLGLAFPKDKEDLKNHYEYYQTKVRGGMNFGSINSNKEEDDDENKEERKKKLNLLTAIQEGAILKGKTQSRIVDLSKGDKKYWKYSSNLALPLHKNFDLG